MDKKRKLFLFSALLFIILFLIVLSQVISNSQLKKLDNSISQRITSIQTPYFIESAKLLGIITDSIPVIIFALILIFFLYRKNYKKDATIFALFLFANTATFYILKRLLAIPRPLNELIAPEDFAFPSGHTATAFFFFGFLFYLSYFYLKGSLRKTAQISFTIAPIIIGFSRIYLNSHWFSDVLGGALIGLFWLSISIFARLSFKK